MGSLIADPTHLVTRLFDLLPPFESPIGLHVTAEINLARFIRIITIDSKKRALELLEALEAYQRALE